MVRFLLILVVSGVILVQIRRIFRKTVSKVVKSSESSRFSDLELRFQEILRKKDPEFKNRNCKSLRFGDWLQTESRIE